MSVLSLLAFVPSILTGVLIVHLLWVGENHPIDLTLKASLGIGVGLGLSAMLYFVYLIFFAGSPYFLCVELVLFLTVLIATYLKNKKTVPVPPSPRLKVVFLQVVILAIAGLVFVSSFLGVVNYAMQRARGDWDAWMIYNRAARFIYRSQETWQDAFSGDMDVIFHADYPPLLGLNIASRWDILSEETAFVPMFQGLLFSLASLGLCFGALARLSLGQAGLGVILLGGVSFFLGQSGRQTADVPLAFYMLATIVGLFFYYREKRAILIALAGFTAGLAAWTKNEGMLFLLASTGILFITALWKRSFKGLLLYFIGLLLPLALLFYFKLRLSPPSEFLIGGSGKMFQDLMDASRHQMIFNSFINYFLHGGGWNNVGISVILAVYFLLFYSRIQASRNAVFISLAILACQIIGYYVFYLISPYDLEWHLSYSLGRLFVHIYPSIVFVVLAASRTPETVFSPNLE
jgi:hypothetical protein